MNLVTEKRTLLTVITEAVIEDALIREIEKLGAHGYTISDARGGGSHGMRDATWGDVANIRLEVIGTREMVESLLMHIKTHFYANYAMVSFLHDVEVLRPDKF